MKTGDGRQAFGKLRANSGRGADFVPLVLRQSKKASKRRTIPLGVGLSTTHKYGKPGPALAEQIRSQARYFARGPDEQ
jgi:hypothetical protein